MKLHGQCYNVVTYHKLITYFFSLDKSNGNKRESLNSKDGKTTVFIDTHSYVPISIFFFFLVETSIILWIKGCILKWAEPSFFTNVAKFWSRKS